MTGRRATSLALALALALGLLAIRPPQPATAFSGIPLATHSFADMLVDPGSSQVFISSPKQDSIVVFDLAGHLLTTITGESGAGRMLVVGSTLYVSLSSGAIDRIDTTNDTPEATPLVTGLTSPNDLAYANGLIWVTTGSPGSVTLASVDPNAVTPVATTYDSLFDSTNHLNVCADFAVNPASNPNYLIVFACSYPGTSIESIDVSGTPTVTASTDLGSAPFDVAVSADSVHVLATFGNEVDEYNLSDLTLDGVIYPGDNRVSAVATTAGNGLKVVSGTQETYLNSVFAYPIGDPAQPVVASPIGAVMNRGIAISPDGLTAYAIAYTLGLDPPNLWLNIVPLPAMPADGSPAAPTGVSATAGVGAAFVTWTAPTYHGTSLITGYKVSSSGGATATVGATTFSTVLAGLSSVLHTFTVQAINGSGLGPPSSPSGGVTPQDGGTYNTLQPSRILDTRNGNGGFPKHRVAANTFISLQVTGRGGVPGSGVSAVVMNLAVTNTGGPGFVTAYPNGFSRPLASSLNYAAGMTVPNLVQVAVGTSGKVNLYVGGAAADLIADVEGYFGDSTDSYVASGLYQNVTPQRMYDTRYISTANGYVHHPLGPNQSLNVPLSMPFGTTSVILNVAVTAPTRAGFLTVYPLGTSQPLASNLNFVAGQTVPNRVIVGLGPGGGVTITNGPGTVDVIVDLDGSFGSYGGPFVPAVPYRFFDTRTCKCKMPPYTIYNLQVTGPVTTGIAFNAAVTKPTAAGFVTLYGDLGQGLNAPIPSSSDLNFTAGQTVANFTPLDMYSSSGFNILNAQGSTDVILDVDGFYGAATPNLGPGPFVPATTKEPRAPVVGPRVSSVRN